MIEAGQRSRLTKRDVLDIYPYKYGVPDEAGGDRFVLRQRNEMIRQVTSALEAMPEGVLSDKNLGWIVLHFISPDLDRQDFLFNLLNKIFDFQRDNGDGEENKRKFIVALIEALRGLSKKGGGYLLTAKNVMLIIDHSNPYEIAEVIRQVSNEFLNQERFELLLSLKENNLDIVLVLSMLNEHQQLSSQNQVRILEHKNPDAIRRVFEAVKRASILGPNIPALLSSENNILFTENVSALLAGIPYDLLTQQVLDNVFWLAKKNNAEQEIAAYLAPIVQYASKREVLAGLDRAKEHNDFEQHEIHRKLIDTPRSIIPMIVAAICIWVIGFQWILDLEERLNLPGKDLALPCIDFFSPLHPDKSEMHLEIIRYHVTPLNFLFVAVNYIVRNISMLLGALIILPWTLPVTLINRAVHGIPRAIYSSKVRQKMEECCADGNQSVLVRDWFDNKNGIGSETIFSDVSADDIRKGMIAYAMSNVGRVRKKHGADYNIEAKFQRLEAFAQRASVLGFVEKQASIDQTIVYIQSFANNIERFAKQEKSAYEIGIEYLNQKDEERAYLFLSRTPSFDLNYPYALGECGRIELKRNNVQAAQAFFERAYDLLFQIPLADPNYSRAMYECGFKEFSKGNAQAAKPFFEKADKSKYYDIGMRYQKIHDNDSAVYFFSRVSPKDENYSNAMFMCVQMENSRVVKNHKLIAEYAKNAGDKYMAEKALEALYDEGMEYIKAGKNDLALNDLCWIPEDHPNYSNAMYYCGKILYASGQYKEALSYAEKASDMRVGQELAILCSSALKEKTAESQSSNYSSSGSHSPTMFRSAAAAPSVQLHQGKNSPTSGKK